MRDVRRLFRWDLLYLHRVVFRLDHECLLWLARCVRWPLTHVGL